MSIGPILAGLLTASLLVAVAYGIGSTLGGRPFALGDFATWTARPIVFVVAAYLLGFVFPAFQSLPALALAFVAGAVRPLVDWRAIRSMPRSQQLTMASLVALILLVSALLLISPTYLLR